MGKRLGDAVDPLLVSVRSGAPFSMPGMMDTVLNLGLNDDSVQGLAKQTDNERFAYDSYRRFVQMFGKIVLDVPGDVFEEALHDLRRGAGRRDRHRAVAPTTSRASSRRSRRSCRRKPASSSRRTRHEQLGYAIEAVFKSWNGDRARDYRRMEKIPDDLGTAVNVQTMVFGNKGDDSGTGVAFTRNPSTGENRALRRLPHQRAGRRRRRRHPHHRAARRDGRTTSPSATQQLLEVMQLLENHYRDMCDIEFTIEQGRLFILQTRVGKRTAAAALRMAVEMAGGGPHRQARGGAARAARAARPAAAPAVRPDGEVRRARQGPERVARARRSARCTSPPTTPRRATTTGEHVILVRPETSPDDLHGMIAAEGILTSRGGLVSHAAVVARGMGKPAICGADALEDRPDGRKQFAVERHRRARGRRHLDQRHDRRGRGRRGRRWSRPSRRASSRRSSAGPTSSAR